MTMGLGNQLGQYESMADERTNYWRDKDLNGEIMRKINSQVLSTRSLMRNK